MTKEEATDAVRQAWSVFLYWLDQTGKDPARTRFTPGRKRKVRARLAEGYGVDRICRAIDGCASSDFHMARGEYAGRTRYNDLTLICRNGEKLEWFEDMAPDPSDESERGPCVRNGVYREPDQEGALADYFKRDEAALRKEVDDG